MASRPVDALLAVTYRCNARCAMCNIWKTSNTVELSPGRWSNIPGTLGNVNISGGEPFLREDLPEIARVVRNACRGARIVISTNGIATDRIASMMSEILKMDGRVGVGVSIDGPEETHDRIRGVNGAYAKAVETVRLLKGMGMRDLRIAYTAMEENAGQMVPVYQLSRELGVQFSCVVAHDSEIYFKISGTRLGPVDSLVDDLSAIAARELKTYVPKRWARAYFYKGLVDFTRTKERILPCLAGSASLFVAPEGELYPCNVMGKSMGNIGQGRFSELWDSRTARDVRALVAACAKPCWMMCSVRPAMRRNLLKAAWWVVRNKLKVHLTGRWKV